MPIGELGHERVLVSMFCCDAGSLVRPVGQIAAGPLVFWCCAERGGAPKAFIRVKRVVVAVTVHGTSRKAKG